MASEWTNAVRGAHLLWAPIPAYAGLPILLWVFHAKVWTFVLAVGICVTLSILKTRGIKVPWLMRRFQLQLRGGVVQARTVWYRRRAQHLRSFDTMSLQDDTDEGVS